MFAKRFFFVSAGLLCLALAYHFGAASATAQISGNTVAAASGGFVVAANGNVYADPALISPTNAAQWVLAGNVFSGPTPTSQGTWGELKARYR